MRLLEMIRSATIAAAGAFGAALIAAFCCAMPASASEDESIRPFRVAVPEGDLVNLRRRRYGTVPCLSGIASSLSANFLKNF